MSRFSIAHLWACATLLPFLGMSIPTALGQETDELPHNVPGLSAIEGNSANPPGWMTAIDGAGTWTADSPSPGLLELSVVGLLVDETRLFQSGVQLSNTWTMETRFLSVTPGSDPGLFSIVSRVPPSETRILVTVDSILTDPADPTQLGEVLHAGLDLDDGAFHVLRVGVDPSGVAHVWIDGVEATFLPEASAGVSEVSIGDSSNQIGSTTVAFDFVRYNTSFVEVIDCDENGIADWRDLLDGRRFAETQGLNGSDSAPSDFFGYSVGVSGDVAIIGAYFDDDSGSNSGSAYTYRFNGSDWVEEQKLVPADGDVDDLYGRDVRVCGDVALVGSLWDDDLGSDSGAAYIYRFNGSAWVEEQKLTASDGGPGDYFGGAISLSGDVVAVGALNQDGVGINSGSAYVYRFDGTSWVEEAVLVAFDGEAGDKFGSSVLVSGDHLMVTASEDDDLGGSSGSVYVYRHDGLTWVQTQKLTASDGDILDRFGSSLGLDGDTLLVGASLDDDAGENSGSVYVFQHDGLVWIETQKLVASDGASGDRFGLSVGIDGNAAVIGASSVDDPGFLSGAMYHFRYNGATWVQEEKLQATNTAQGDRFGWRVAISGDVIVSGSPNADAAGSLSGSATVFTRPQIDCDENGLLDECEIADGAPDCDLNGVLDSCDLAAGRLPDAMSPEWSDVPGTINVFTDSGSCFATVNWTPPIATDNCTIVDEFSSHVPGEEFSIGTTTVVYTAIDSGQNFAEATFDIIVTDPSGLCEPSYIRGDANADLGVDVGDTVFVLQYLFNGGADPDCLDSADVNDDQSIDVADVVYELGFLFTMGSAPNAPFPNCGVSPNSSLGCVESPCP